MCLKESCFPDSWKFSSVVSVFKNVGERSTAKNCHPVSLHSVVSKVFEKPVNNRINDWKYFVIIRDWEFILIPRNWKYILKQSLASS